jgi:hypothetical protein
LEERVVPGRERRSRYRVRSTAFVYTWDDVEARPVTNHQANVGTFSNL